MLFLNMVALAIETASFLSTCSGEFVKYEQIYREQA